MAAESCFKRQIAALPVRGGPGTYEVLLVTSRETQRWIAPKGWPMKKRKDCDAAAREALEEAGVKGRIRKRPLGTYTYEKRLPEGSEQIHVRVYMLEVDKELKSWPESEQRQRAWFSVEEAAERVDEPDLSKIIAQLGITARDAFSD